MDIKKQVALNTAGYFALMFGQWVISVALVRLGGFADAGIFSLAMSVANVFTSISNYGVRTFQVSDTGDQFSQGQYFYARVLTVVLSFALGCVYLALDSAYSPLVKCCIMLYLLYTNAGSFSDVLFGSLQLKGQLYVNGYSNLFKSVCCLAVFFLSYVFFKSLWLSLAFMAAIDIVVAVLYDVRCYLRVVGRPFGLSGCDAQAVRKIMALCFPLMISSLLPFVTTVVPRRDINMLMGEDALGIFSSLFTPSVIITTLVPSIVVGVVPAIAGHWNNREKGAFARKTAECYLGCLAITALAMVCALIAGRPVMKLFFGEEILPYFDLLYLAILVSGINAMKGCGGSVLVCMRRAKTVTVSAVAELVVAFVMSRILVARIGISGAALALLAAYSASLLIETADIVWFGRKFFSGACGQKE